MVATAASVQTDRILPEFPPQSQPFSPAEPGEKGAGVVCPVLRSGGELSGSGVARVSVFSSRLLLFGLGVAIRGTAVPDAYTRLSAAIAKIAEAR